MEAMDVITGAGIMQDGEFTRWLTETGNACQDLLERVPPIAKVDSGDDYRYAKATLATYRKQLKEAEEGRKRITGALDAAKKACMEYVRDSTAPLSEAIDATKRLKEGYEESARARKRERLETYWEASYPALALCTGEAAEPLVPFSRVFNPDWTKRLSECLDDGSRDGDALGAMDRIAARLAKGQEDIEASDQPSDVKAMAVGRMFETLDPLGALAWAREEARRQADIKRLQEASAGSDVASLRPEQAPAPSKPLFTVEAAVKPTARRLVLVWADTDEELASAKSAMKAAGLHGCVGKVVR